jgi:hypothetical protein
MPSEESISVSGKIIAAISTLHEDSSGEIKARLIYLINEMIDTDFNALLQLLYRIDVDEKNLKDILKENGGVNAAAIISDLIIKRQLEKIETRKQFGNRIPPAHDDGW